MIMTYMKFRFIRQFFANKIKNTTTDKRYMLHEI